MLSEPYHLITDFLPLLSNCNNNGCYHMKIVDGLCIWINHHQCETFLLISSSLMHLIANTLQVIMWKRRFSFLLFSHTSFPKISLITLRFFLDSSLLFSFRRICPTSFFVIPSFSYSLLLSLLTCFKLDLFSSSE